MESTNNNSNQMFLSELKELRNELSDVKKRIVQLEESHEKQQEKINILERENNALKTELDLNLNGIKAVGSVLKRKRTDQAPEKEIESKSASDKKKTKTNNNIDDEVTVLPRYDTGDSFDCLSDDLLHKIVEFNGNCYSKFGLINKRCKNIYDVKEYKLKKETYVYGYGTVEMILEYYLRKRKAGTLDTDVRWYIAYAVIWYNRLDAIDWIIQLGDNDLLHWVCSFAAAYGRINVLTRVFCKYSLAMLDKLLNGTNLCNEAARNGKLETLKWLRKYSAEWDEDTFMYARRGQDEIVQYLRDEGCPGTQDEDSGDDSPIFSDDEDGDN